MHDSTELLVAAKPALVGRPRINAPGETFTARFRDGTLARVKAALTDGEKQSDFVRAAVEKELDRRKA